MKINFFTEDVPFKISSPSILRKWISSVVEQEQRVIGQVNYIFCSDTYLHNINLHYLNHDTYTDIITFDNSDSPGTLVGDIYISIERIRENAEKYASDFKAELHRVIIHGILHLCGHNDKSTTQQEAMRKREDACLSLLHIP